MLDKSTRGSSLIVIKKKVECNVITFFFIVLSSNFHENCINVATLQFMQIKLFGLHNNVQQFGTGTHEQL